MPFFFEVCWVEHRCGEHRELKYKATEHETAQLGAGRRSPLGLERDVPRAYVEDVVPGRAGPAARHEEAQPVVVEHVDDDGGHACARGLGRVRGGVCGGRACGGGTCGELELDDVAECEEGGERVEVPLVQSVLARGEDLARARVAHEELGARRVHVQLRLLGWRLKDQRQMMTIK